jgi:hypothetical protein
MTPVRVCVVRGTWQFVTLLAALAEHRARGGPDLPMVVLHDARVTPERRAVFARLGTQAGVDRALWIDDLTSGLAESPIDDEDLTVRVASLRARVGADVAEVWLNTTRSGRNWLVHRAFRGAPVFVYEDGLIMYVETSGRQVTRAAGESRLRFAGRALRFRAAASLDAFLLTPSGRRLWRRLGHLGGRKYSAMRAWRASRFDPRAADSVRPAAAYLALASLFPPNAQFRESLRVIRPHLLERVIREVAPATAVRDDHGPRPRALVLDPSDPRDLDTYVAAIEKLHAAGFSVYWKDHPRTHEPALEQLRDALPAVPIRALPVDPNLPAELALVNHPVDLIVGAWSSTLFYARLLWGTETARVESATEVAHSPDRALLVELARRHVPDLDSVLQLRAAPPYSAVASSR